MPTLSIAYHNIAVELEHLNRLPASLEYYKKSVNLAE